MRADGGGAVAAGQPRITGDGVEHGEPGGRAVDHRGGHRPVDGDDRVAGDGLQQPVQAEDLPPVGGPGGGGLGVHGGDRGLQLERPGRPGPQRRRGQGGALLDRGAVPAGAVLLVEGHERAAAGACRAAGVGEQHQREQAGDVAAAGEPGVQQPGEADRLRGQLDPVEGVTGGADVTLGEHEVQHVEHDVEPLVELAGRRQPERGAGLADPGLGAADPLRDGRLRGQQRPGDLGGAETADGAQGEGELRGRGQRRVAAQEQQGQRVVLVGGRGHRRPPGGLAAGPGLFAAQQVDEAAGRDPDQPGARLLRHPVRRPLGRRGEQCLLHRVLAGVEVPVAAHQRAEHLRDEVPQVLRERLSHA